MVIKLVDFTLTIKLFDHRDEVTCSSNKTKLAESELEPKKSNSKQHGFSHYTMQKKLQVNWIMNENVGRRIITMLESEDRLITLLLDQLLFVFITQIKIILRADHIWKNGVCKIIGGRMQGDRKERIMERKGERKVRNLDLNKRAIFWHNLK